MHRKERMYRFVDEIWSWYARHKRSLPWRDLAIKDDTERAYRILVSEIMLQQTHVSRVIIIYKRFLRQFPRLHDLAAASNRDVILAWRGMGYNSRALRLRDAARTILARGDRVRVRKTKNRQNSHRPNPNPNPHFSSTMQELTSIPGIGPYTAAAIRNFAFNFPTPCIDTNIRRILHRTFFGPENADGSWPVDDGKLLKLTKEVLHVAVPACHPELRVIPSVVEGRRGDTRSQRAGSTTLGMTRCEPFLPRDTANWHAALMDFGSLVQTKKNPQWHLCPLTAAGIMKTTQRSFERLAVSYKKSSKLKAQSSKPNEPGRHMGGRFVPNRIFRGKIIDALRDAERGLPLQRIGREICLDWADEHRAWLDGLIEKLVREGFVAKKGEVYLLSE